jgi:hypothetical protein
VWFRRTWVTATAVAVASIYAGVVSAAVRSAPATSLIAIEAGSLVTLLGTIALAVGAILTARTEPGH